MEKRWRNGQEQVRQRQIVMFRYFTQAGLSLALITTVAYGQEHKASPPQEKPSRLGTQLVQLDVIVSDQNGETVRGLRPEDFAVFEDGKRQRLDFFAAKSRPLHGGRRASADAGSAREESARDLAISMLPQRSIAMLIDNLHIAPENLARLKPQLIRFVDEEMLDGDSAAVVTTAGGMGYIQQFTSDREALKVAIQRISSFALSDGETDSPPISEYDAMRIEGGDVSALDQLVSATIRDRGMDDTPIAKDIGARLVEGRARRILAQADRYAWGTLSTVCAVVRQLTGLPGRKVVIFASDGFAGLGQGEAAKSAEMMKAVDAATRAEVAIYSADSRGLETDDLPASGSAQLVRAHTLSSEMKTYSDLRRAALIDLAQNTGGIALTNTNDLRALFKRISADDSFYYVLAYYSNQEKRDGKWRDISVRVRDRDDLRIRTPRGYYGTRDSARGTEGAPAGDLAAPLIDSLLSPIPRNEIGVRLGVNFIDADDEGLVAIADVDIAGSKLSFAELRNEGAKESRYSTDLDVIGVAANEKGEFAGKFALTLPLRLKKRTVAFVRAAGISVREHLALRPGLYLVRIAVREKLTGLAGTAASWIEIPDLSAKKLSLGSIFLRPGEESGRKNEDGLATESRQFPSQSVRRFRQNQAVDVFTTIYNPAGNSGDRDPEIMMQTQILKDSVPVFTAPPRRVELDPASGAKRLPYGVQISLQGFPPGRYVLKMEAVDRKTSAAAEQSVSFTIE